jgi:hypothetical protein
LRGKSVAGRRARRIAVVAIAAPFRRRDDCAHRKRTELWQLGYNFAQYQAGIQVAAPLRARREKLEPGPSMLSFKFFGAILPLVILGHIFGLLVAAAFYGWHINPLIILLNGVGILIALWECKLRF